MVSKIQLPHLLALDTVNLFKILAVLIAGWWYCVLKSVSLLIDYSENLFLCLVLSLSFSDQVFAQIFYPFCRWVVCLFIERCWSVVDLRWLIRLASMPSLASQFLSVLWKSTNFNFD